ncbi:MAG TPA: TAT-variant-translocated molybdopterin oxidoreductase [Polyangiaceae bacterium]|nr:TAT-variant-translocated molybdopterin oxidoreductase [Polyangiaceae bacterium]
MSSLKNGDRPKAAGAEPVLPTYWRSLPEREASPEFLEKAAREFATPPENETPNSPTRRRFMQILGAGSALATAAGCRWTEDKMLAPSKSQEGRIPGETRKFATAVDIAGVAVGVLATSYDGRPIKLEGNPAQSSSLGALGAVQQAQVLELYDPDRSRHPRQGTEKKTWDDFATFARTHIDELKAKDGEGLAILVGASSSPTRAYLKTKLTTLLPKARFVEWEAADGEGTRRGTLLAFGAAQQVRFDLAAADIVLTLDADIAHETYPNGLANARAAIKRRDPDAVMNRIYAVESGYTRLGSVADHRLALRAELIKAFTAALDAQVSAALSASGAQAKPSAAFLSDTKTAKFLEVLAKDLVAAKGRCVIAAGEHQPPEVHALVARLNTTLENVGKTVFYTEDPRGEAPSRLADLKALTAELNGNKISSLMILGSNPAYTAPSDLNFAAAIPKAATTVHVGLYDDETAKLCGWHVNEAHWLESWGDSTAPDGTVSLQQPLIAPLFNGKSVCEVLGMLSGESAASGLDLVKYTHRDALGDPRKLRRAIHDGVVPGAKPEAKIPELKELAPVALNERENGAADVGNGQYELRFVNDGKVLDGRFANSSWLQELPDSYTKLTWGNAALMAPKTAEAIGAVDGQAVTLNVAGKSLPTFAVLVPGLAQGSVHLALGYGRTRAGRVGGHEEKDIAAVGANAYSIRTSEAHEFVGGLQVAAGAAKKRLATTQDTHTIDQVGREGVTERLGMLVREGSLKEYKDKPDFAKHAVHHPPLLNLWTDPIAYDGHKWGMAIDLSKCIGCSACITACQAENNIPSVGEEQVAVGRELHWLRVDRYFKGSADEPEVAWQPLPCMQCENAPCEQVCPVGATMHSHEGLNDMVYNRCIGTRYCANNCPYKVRRFNYLNYNLDIQGTTPFHGFKDDDARVKSMVFNPEVSLRARGVMEKCTFCVQRIQNTKIKAKNAKQAIPDGAIATACQQTCPTGAIVFGDLNDSGSAVAAEQRSPRSYGLLEELNNRPRVRYLARVKNPNPELV